MPARLLIEARPGAGKTTALSRLAERLGDGGAQLGGFLTREIRSEGRRTGFEIETFAGERGVLAHVDFPGPPRVGRYGVDLEEFERLGDVRMVATVHTFRHPFTDALKARPDVSTVRLTAANRDRLPEELASRLRNHPHDPG